MGGGPGPTRALTRDLLCCIVYGAMKITITFVGTLYDIYNQKVLRLRVRLRFGGLGITVSRDLGVLHGFSVSSIHLARMALSISSRFRA